MPDSKTSPRRAVARLFVARLMAAATTLALLLLPHLASASEADIQVPDLTTIR